MKNLLFQLFFLWVGGISTANAQAHLNFAYHQICQIFIK
jgi:hypothetical protein